MTTRNSKESQTKDAKKAPANASPGGSGSGRGVSNAFFAPYEGNDEPAERVLATYQVPEPPELEGQRPDDASEDSLQLECIDYDWLQAQPAPLTNEGWAELLQRAPLAVLEVPRDYLPLGEFEPGQVAYFDIALERGPGANRLRARFYRSLFAPGRLVYLGKAPSRARPTEQKALQALAHWLNERHSRDVSPGKELYTGSTGILKACSTAGGVAVYDVGQGAWQAVLDADKKPVLYVDAGGGVFYNARTFPKTGFGTPHVTPLILLSHWDWDHWSSAHRYRSLLATTWLAPPVPATAIQLAFALDILAASGKLVIWNSSWPASVQVGKLLVERCTGKDSNDSGLAVTVYTRLKLGRTALLPGDAAYKYIPSVNVTGARYNALCMSHHGGRLHSKHYPTPKRVAVAANSSGPRNTYKHPLFNTLAAHVDKGWPMPAQTAISGSRPCHVVLHWGKRPHYYLGGCDLKGAVIVAKTSKASFVPAPVAAAA